MVRIFSALWVGVVLIGMAICLSNTASAQSSASTGTLQSATLLRQAVLAGWFQFQVDSGRIRFLPDRRPSSRTPNPRGGKQNETLLVRKVQGESIISYQLVSSDEQFSIEAGEKDRFLLDRLPKKNSDLVRVSLHQSLGKPLILIVGDNSQERRYEAPTLWSMAIVYRGAFREHVLPLFLLLRPKWKLEATLNQVEAELWHFAANKESHDRSRWHALVAQLSDTRFSQREAADRELRAAGRPIVRYLESLDPASLDAEQQFRIHRILHTLSSHAGDDSPRQVAQWLASDKAVWLALLERSDTDSALLAVEQLKRLSGRPIIWDSAAEGAERQKQVDRLRHELLPE